MKVRRWHARYALVLGAALLAAGCGGGDEKEAGPPVAVDTTNKDWADGLSAEQIESQATSMTPEEAAARGIVDTTIHVENLGPDSSAFGRPTAAAPVDTTKDTPAPPAGPTPLQADTPKRAQR